MSRHVSQFSPALVTACIAGAFAPSSAHGATASTTMGVSATVTANCTVSTTAIAFGPVNPIAGTNIDGTGSVTVTCTNGTAWAVDADEGGGSGATLADRRMTAGGNLLSYDLYTNAARTTLWGDGTASTVTVAGTGTGAAQAATIYGRVPSGQTTVAPGSYADTVSVTVTY